ncbi:MAG TPA: proton-conducting transporter transmembrane domain-containing protein [Candidatus Wunengus sp. YC63]|uniref:proton-conducting transporter transmembrane domain-containing protein n=1 Tax=unclassified Candidatus Wunengus TaxID=3367695 RepID=UPI00402A11D3
MDEKSLITYLVYYFIVSPIAKIFFVNIHYFIGKQERDERPIRKLVKWGNVSDFIHVAVALYFLGLSEIAVQIESFGFLGWSFIVHWNTLTFIFLSFTTIIIAVIGHFSLFYLHRDAYYHKFFSLYFIFHLAIKLIVLSSDTVFFFMGWELLGFSSVLLIAFYEHRSNPLKNAMRVLFIYESGDIFLLSLIALLTFLHIEDMTHLALIQEHGYAWAMVLLIIAFFFKSGIFPWTWLPRAMEGPTPSSAAFYGSLSTHIPIFLLLRFWPNEWSLPSYWPEVWTISHPANAIAAAVAICAFSAFITTHMSRQHADAKNTIAYATMTQLAIIYIEIFFGLRTLALIHVVSHGIYRTFEFLRTPSLLHFYHTMETRLPKMTNPGKHFNTLLPEGLRNWLYALSIKEFGFFLRTFDFIDGFLGLKFLRFDGKAMKRFAWVVAVSWSAFSIVMFFLDRNTFIVKSAANVSGDPITAFIINWKYFNPKDELLLALAVGFSVLTFCNIRKVGMFFVTLTCSAVTIGIEHTLLLLKHLDASNQLYWIAVTALAVAFAGLAFYSVYNFTTGSENYSSYTARFSRSTLANLLLFIAALSIVGVPGLGIVLAWEYLLHYTAQVAPFMVIKGFFIIKLDTLLVFLFYFSNFLGFPEHKVQMLHHYKLGTLHLRWAQKHSEAYPVP